MTTPNPNEAMQQARAMLREPDEPEVKSEAVASCAKVFGDLAQRNKRG